MNKVFSYGSENWKGVRELSDLSSKDIKKCIGSNVGLNNMFRKGSLDTQIVLSCDAGWIVLPGSKAKGSVKPIERLLGYVIENFSNIGEDGKYFFTIRDIPEDDKICLECSNGMLFSYNTESGVLVIDEYYSFAGEVDVLKDRFLSFIGLLIVMKIPLKCVFIHPKSEESFSKDYFKGKNEFYIGFREVVFDENTSDSFKMYCGYEETPGEYAMAMLV